MPLPKTRFMIFTLIAVLLIAVSASSENQSQSSRAAADDEKVQQLYTEARREQAEGNLAEAATRYEAILKIAPRLAAAYNNLGSIYVQQREFRKAAQVLQRGLEINRDMPSASALLGIALYEIGDYAAAKPRLEVALRANPNDGNAALYLANDSIHLGEFEKAAERLQLLSRQQPKNEEVWYLLGKVYMQLSQSSLAKLNEINPNSYLSHQISGEVMESMNNLDGALLEYKKAVELAPEKPGTHYHLANAYWSLLLWEPAKKEFTAELAIDPKNCQAQWKLGDILIEQQAEPQNSLTELDKALALCPDLPEAHEDRGRVLLKLERYEEAAKDLQIAATADPAEPRPHFLLSQAYRALGRTREAQAEMGTFSKLQEASQSAKAARAREILQNKDSAPTQ
ncbi:MAG TPA: tetratricopeptide repeat protein [Candidatus Acidoferrum sp.]|nr:tetratricopeptide repeat protein [Candidatus Acidoferrum sp.]